ncbi:Beclin-1-like protein [Gryllus bimaculatus]|nr:Beclin-1-like protein [Gryllus bimaculatus]
MVEPKCIVGFVCQRCLQPIKLDTGFNNLGEHTLAELSLPIHTTPEVDLEAQAGSFDQYIPPFRLTDSGNGANGFTVVGEEGETESLSHHMRVRAALFDIMSGASEVDHPLCEECTDTLLNLMDQQLKLTEDEWNDYSEFLKKLEMEDEEQGLEILEKDLEDLKTEEESLECQLHYTQAQLSKLKKTNVFNATFLIWHSGHFGTINNFRLGRLPSVPVDWSEINAAWGQTALLLTALARKMNLTFERYRIVLSEHRKLPLYGSGGFRFLWDTKFDAAMVAFLDCLQQFKEEVEKGDSGFCLPYRMDKGKIEDSASSNSFSIKIQFNSEEQWTKALKFLLTNLKWCLAWVSSQFAKDEAKSLLAR